jgi:signal transduction histidine kinase
VSRTAEGTGLGLAIVQELAEAQGGTVRYEPNEPVGARFCVRLAAAGPAEEASTEPAAG